MMDGRRALGYGDFSVGCHLPSWMEARGLRDVGARTNERVAWIAPPYQSPNSRLLHRNMRERLKVKVRYRVDKSDVEQMRAGGLSRAKFDLNRQRSREQQRAFRKAMKDGTAAFAAAPPVLVCLGLQALTAAISSASGPALKPNAPKTDIATDGTMTGSS